MTTHGDTDPGSITALSVGSLDLHAARPGWVHLVGAGPGDPGLLTLRGAALLASADLIAWDRLVDKRILELASSGAESIRVGKDPDRTCGRRTWTQDEINDLLVTAALQGKAVVRLKGGDPFVFGRGSEEALACRAAGVDFEVISGVSSAIAGPAAAGIPVTHRGLATGVAFITGHEDPRKPTSQLDWDALARFHGTLVFLMGVRRAPLIAASLQAGGRAGATPVAVVHRATTADQQVLHTTLERLPEDLASSGWGSPAVIIVGDVVRLGPALVDSAAAARPHTADGASASPLAHAVVDDLVAMAPTAIGSAVGQWHSAHASPAISTTQSPDRVDSPVTPTTGVRP